MEYCIASRLLHVYLVSLSAAGCLAGMQMLKADKLFTQDQLTQKKVVPGLRRNRKNLKQI